MEPTVFVACEAKSTQNGTMYKFKEQSGRWVATNDSELAAKTQQLLNQPVVAAINTVTSNKVNPNNGQPYINHYLNRVEPASTVTGTATTGAGTLQAPQAAASTLPQPGHAAASWTTTPPQLTFPPPGTGMTGATGITFQATPQVTVEITARDRSIWAQSASKVAAELLKFFPEAERTLLTFDNLVQREIDKYGAHHRGDINSEAAANGAFGAAGAAPADQAKQDDIPF